MTWKERKCPCGSGKRFEDCCGAGNKIIDFSAWRWKKASRLLRAKLGEYTEEEFLEEGRNRAFVTYFGELEVQELDDLDETVWNDFLEWFIFDFPVIQGQTLVQIFAEREAPKLSIDEKKLLNAWSNTRIGVYQVKQIHQQRGLELEDVLRGGEYFVEDIPDSEKVDRWELLIGRLLPVGEIWELSAGAIILPPHCKQQLLKSLEEDYLDSYELDFAPAKWDWDSYLRDWGFQVGYLAEELFETFLENNPLLANSLTGEEKDKDITFVLDQFWQVILEEEKYDCWLENPNNDLDGLSPTEAAQSKRGRQKLKRLINGLEQDEKKKLESGQPAYPVELLKKKLGLSPGMKQDVGDYSWGNPDYRAVAELVQQEMSKHQFLPGQIANALRLWFDFTRRENLTFRKPTVWAATVIYTIGRVDCEEEITQTEVSSWLEVSAQSISVKYRQISKALGVEDFDNRYGTKESPLTGLQHILGLIDNNDD